MNNFQPGQIGTDGRIHHADSGKAIIEAVFDDPTVVAQAHIIDDLSRDLGDLRRKTAQARSLLTDALHAMHAGNVTVADEFMHRAIGHLTPNPFKQKEQR